MIVRLAAALAGMAITLGAGPAYAGPCTDRIYQTDLDVAKLLNSAAAQGRPATHTAFATMHDHSSMLLMVLAIWPLPEAPR